MRDAEQSATDRPRSVAPLTIAILLLLVVLYIGGYLALVTPRRAVISYGSRKVDGVARPTGQLQFVNYRFGSSTCEQIFWPLEQIDRRARPAAWRGSYLETRH